MGPCPIWPVPAVPPPPGVTPAPGLRGGVVVAEADGLAVDGLPVASVDEGEDVVAGPVGLPVGAVDVGSAAAESAD